MIQFYFNGQEFTTRARLEEKYDIPHTTLQTLLDDRTLKKIVDGNKFYFLKIQAETMIEAYIQKQLLDKAAKKSHLVSAPKFDNYRFNNYNTS